MPGGGAIVDVDGVVSSVEDDEAEMTASMASAIAASSSVELEKWTTVLAESGGHEQRARVEPMRQHRHLPL